MTRGKAALQARAELRERPVAPLGPAAAPAVQQAQLGGAAELELAELEPAELELAELELAELAGQVAVQVAAELAVALP